MKRLPVLLLIGALIAAILGSSMALPGAPTNAQGTETPVAPSLPTQRPIIVAVLPDGSKVEGVLDSSCWPQPTPATPVCQFEANPEPTTVINLESDQQLVISLEPALDTPLTGLSAFIAPDFESSTGAGNTVDLLATQGVITTSDLPTDVPAIRVQVSAYYANSDNAEYFVIANFRIVTAGGKVPTAIALATEQVTAEVLPATLEATAETTESATEQALLPTQESETATAEVIEPATAPATVEVTAPTPAAVTAEATTGATVAATQGTIAATSATGTKVSTATIPPTATATDTATATATPTATNTPSNTPTPTFTLTPSNTPTDTPTPTATYTPTNTPTNTPIAPDLFVRVGGRDFYPLRTTAYLANAPEKPVNLPPSTLGNTIRIVAAPSDAAQINFTGPRPQAVSVKLRTSDGISVIEEQTLVADNLVLYTIPATPGSYVLEIGVSYGAAKAIYYFRLVVGN